RNYTNIKFEKFLTNIINNKYNLKDLSKEFIIKLKFKGTSFIFKLHNTHFAFALTILFISLISMYFINLNTSTKTNSKNIVVYENKLNETKKNNLLYQNPNIPQYIKYKNLNTKKLRKYLYTKNSLLAEEPYFSSIISAAKEFDINPLILFAITGQEQAFVPKDTKSSKKIANNPFNVFHSWKEYNSNIKDSSTVAARTVFNILKTMPKGKNPFKWINKTYAEDPHWHKGVKSIFYQLKKAVN
ncbi:glucosaminidase domain-containing protein, partial [Clostridium botulinum]|nr:glucosaminidase domain-containing protein [Clostridium botulinum]